MNNKPFVLMLLVMGVFLAALIILQMGIMLGQQEQAYITNVCGQQWHSSSGILGEPKLWIETVNVAIP